MNIGKFSSWLRSNKNIYLLYYYILSSLLRFLGIFIRTNPKRILFVSFGGLKYDDSPKDIYLALIKDASFSDHEFYWAFTDKAQFTVPKGEKIPINSLKYFYYALSSGIWITNSSIERGLSFKKSNIIYINTWHGSPIKKMGSDLPLTNESFKSKGRNSWNIQLAQSEFEANIFSRVFNIESSKIKVIGLPRNDRLAKVSSEEVTVLKKKLGLPLGKKIILYAPTFREYMKDDSYNSIFPIPLDIPRWHNELGNDYIVLIRAHYDIMAQLNLPPTGFAIDVSSYANLNDLMIVSDMLISDYSSIFFDYSILERPMLCYAPDYYEYNEKRGVYFDIRKELGDPIISTENDLLIRIKNLDLDKSVQIVRNFKNKYVTAYGNAINLTVDILHNLITNKQNNENLWNNN